MQSRGKITYMGKSGGCSGGQVQSRQSDEESLLFPCQVHQYQKQRSEQVWKWSPLLQKSDLHGSMVHLQNDSLYLLQDDHGFSGMSPMFAMTCYSDHKNICLSRTRQNLSSYHHHDSYNPLCYCIGRQLLEQSVLMQQILTQYCSNFPHMKFCSVK